MADGVSLMTGLFADHESAERAYTSLASRGYTAADVRLLMTGETRDRLLAAAVRRRSRDKNEAIDGLVTALVAARIPEARAALYDQGLCAGGIVMGVTPRSSQDAEHLQREWGAVGGRQIFCPLLRKNAA
jgi:hypothetical protein